jgi:hypothetical protein
MSAFMSFTLMSHQKLILHLFLGDGLLSEPAAGKYFLNTDTKTKH